MLIKEEYINATENAEYGESEQYAPYTSNIGKLFKSLQKEFGRCISKVYIDNKEKSNAIGWVFQKRTRYEDTREIYLQETWVTLYEKEDKHTVKHYY